MKRIHDEVQQLENLYNIDRSGRLTGLKDVDYTILASLDIKTLNRFCTTSKYANNLCNNQQFWINKIQHDGLPLHIIDKENMNTFNTYDDWLNTYGTLEDTVFVAKNIMLIGNMHEKINIILDLNVAEQILNVKVPDNVKKLLVIYDVKKKKTYVVVYEDTEYVNKYHGDFYDILLKTVYYTLIGYNNSIMDDLAIDYYINPNNYQPYVDSLVNDEHGRELADIALMRVGMWKMIYYNERK